MKLLMSTLAGLKMKNPTQYVTGGGGGPRENISRREWSVKSRGSLKALQVWKKFSESAAA